MPGPDEPSEEDALNSAGDEHIETTGTHGPDISSQRLDTLDRRALEDALARGGGFQALDIGCGMGAQTIRFALVGGDVTAVDRIAVGDRLADFDAAFSIGAVTFRQQDAATLGPADLPAELDIIYSQRMIQYLQYGTARDLLARLADVLAADGTVYLSASGLNTELGEGYPDSEEPLESRFATLAPADARKHGINEQVCLYDVADMRRLLTEAGLQVAWIDTSTFGNVKAKATKG
jgi:SAM-dependent methyltransferase